MKKNLLIVLVFFCSLQLLYSQEDGVVSFVIPVRNSLKFNRFVVNPAFSFVREPNSYISFFNKREWVQFDNAPQTYLVSYSGRFRENQGVAFGLFQQNYGVLSTMGAIGNFAHNVTLDSDANLTFGVNVGFYKSGLDESKVVTNYSDPSLQNIPSNALMTINPGINYGTTFFDFGLAANNFFLYNFSSSNFIKDDLEKGIEAHVMYTGYIDSYGFFDRSKVTGLLKTELKKEQTILSGQMMISIPKGVWAQAGYNTFYGLSAGLGLNITPKISLEYNYEKSMGDFSNFGASHEIVFAYKFKSNEYGDDDEDEGSIIPPADTRKPVTQAPKVDAEAIAKARAEAAERAKLASEARAKAQADAAAKAKLEEEARLKAQADAAAQAKLAAEARAKSYAEAALKLKLDTEAKSKGKTNTNTKLAAEAKAKSDAALKAKLAADAKAKSDAALKAKLAVDAKAKSDAALKAKQAADAKAKADADAALKAKQAADAKAKADADAALQAKLAADAKAKSDAEAALKAKQAADSKAKADADAALQAKLAADAKAKSDADAALKAKQAADAKAKADADAALQAKLAADAKAKSDAEDALKAKQAADAKAKADADAALQAKLAADAKAKADADAALQAKLAADAKAKADADATLQAKLAADAKAKSDAEAALIAKQAADAKAKADADAALKAKQAADAKAKADADAALQAKLAADAKAKADADAVLQAKLAADAKAKSDAEAALQAKLAADAKAKSDAEAALQAKLAADAKAKADEEVALKAKLAADALAKANTPKDENAKSMDNLTQNIETSNKNQQELLDRLNTSVANKEKDLKELREENDLSEKGIFKEPKPFKSTAAENSELESLKSQLTQVSNSQKQSIEQLTNLYNERIKKGSTKNDALTQSYLTTINNLKAEQVKVQQANAALLSSLEEIKVQTEIEKKRRIKRAAFETDQRRYEQDMATLKRIKETTNRSTTPLKTADFDFGTEQSNMQILKKVKNVDSGYYLILAVHNEAAKRDDFLTKVVSTGESNINFFYNVNSSEYFIYNNKFDNLQDATKALEAKGDKPYNSKMIIIKVEKD